MPVRRQSTVRANRPWNVQFDNNGNVMVNEDGVRLYRHEWLPREGIQHAKAAVFFCHGGMEHCRRYDATMNKLTDHNFLCVAHDYQGHGRSEGDRCMCKDVKGYVRDICAELREIRRKFPSLPLFLMGTSMGGLLACLASTEVPVEGLVLLAPAVKPDPHTATKGKVRMANFLAKLFPRVGVARLHYDWISHDKEAVDSYVADDLVYSGKMRAAYAVAILRACDDLNARVNEVTAPLLILHGEEDKLTSMEGSNFLMDNAPNPDKKLMTFPGLFHDLLHEMPQEAEKVEKLIIDWLKEHSGPMPLSEAEPQLVTADQVDIVDPIPPVPEDPRSPPPSMADSTANPKPPLVLASLEQTPLSAIQEHQAEGAEGEMSQEADQAQEQVSSDRGQALEGAIELPPQEQEQPQGQQPEEQQTLPEQEMKMEQPEQQAPVQQQHEQQHEEAVQEMLEKATTEHESLGTPQVQGSSEQEPQQEPDQHVLSEEPAPQPSTEMTQEHQPDRSSKVLDDGPFNARVVTV